jgi:RNA polymerase sigma factor (sigma-70 family)
MDRSGKQVQEVAFEACLVRVYPQLLRLALRLCRNHADAYDLAQAAVERGLKHRTRFRTGDSPDRWMVTILRRMFFDDCRERRRRARVPLLDEHESVTTLEPEPLAAWEEFTLEDVQRALLFVDVLSREVFSLFVFRRLAQEEVARRLDISPKTVATRMFRTRAKLRKLLETGQYRRCLVLVPTPGEATAAACGRLPPRPPSTRTEAVRARKRVAAAGIA